MGRSRKVGQPTMVRFEANGNWERLGNTYNERAIIHTEKEKMNLLFKCMRLL